ncbi:MAG: rod shape-determining protein MreD [Atribacterota bacterium]
MKILVKAGIIVATLMIELVMANILSFDAVKPDLMLIVVICLSFISGAEEGIIAGFTGGLLKDIFSVHLLGINALVKTVIGYIAGVIREKIFSQHLMWIVAIFTFIFTFMNNLIIYFLINALYSNYDFAVILKRFMLSQAIINSMLAPLIFIGIRKIFVYIRRWS